MSFSGLDLQASLDEAFLRHRRSILGWDDPMSPVLGQNFGEFSAEVHNLGGIVDPHEQDH